MKKLHIGRSLIHGKGLFCATDIKKGDFIGFIHGPIIVIKKFTPSISKKILNWIGVGKHSWIDTSKSIFKSINHSCNPNVYIKTKRGVYALTDIPKGTELTMDYSLTEAEAGWKLSDCRCGEKNCRGTILPIHSLPKDFVFENRHIMTKTFFASYRSTHNLSPE